MLIPLTIYIDSKLYSRISMLLKTNSAHLNLNFRKMRRYIRETCKLFCICLITRRCMKCLFACIVVSFLVSILTNLNFHREQRTRKEMKYFFNQGLHLFSAQEYVPKSSDTLIKNSASFIDISLKLELDLQTQINNSISESIQDAKGIIYILESSFLSDPIEGFRRFVSLQRLVSPMGLLTVLPQVDNGYYFTLNCTYKSARARASLSINKYFNIAKLQHIMMSYNLMPFISPEIAKNIIFPALTIVFFAYDEDIVEVPNTPTKNVFTRTNNSKLHQEYSYYHRSTIFKHFYAKDCSYYLRDLSGCISNQLSELNAIEYQTSHVLCVDAMRPSTLENFFKELKLGNNGNTIVFVDWRGYQDITHTKLEPKLTLSQHIHDHILIIPFSDLINQATEKLLSSLWYPYYSYLSAVIDLKTLLDMKLELTTHEFNICIDKLYNNIRYINHGYSHNRLIITNAFHPFSLEFDNYSKNSLFELIWDKFSHGYTPMVSSHDDLFPAIKDFGLYYLVDVNLVRYSGTTIILSRKSRSRSLYSYYYDNHVNDFSVTFHEFKC